ncbi:uncharacterized protein TRAVEDRAFT_51931 [Trametes versicolor FP-101664 SS1]|uniref:uncharacterized protein n=1 Tax=Trametes versicolor (strain FP-101664) TaxID=717944 RepID=UPI0004621820|nr:uncharacterized protein TRAVEDRAFT_51931 [Trametes versicolor FP-101664 SS1]EIW54214.1 hypothetical protein TRAVEDRAFT_51931 [Trametes versicolor FP-101664 SS1]
MKQVMLLLLSTQPLPHNTQPLCLVAVVRGSNVAVGTVTVSNSVVVLVTVLVPGTVSVSVSVLVTARVLVTTGVVVVRVNAVRVPVLVVVSVCVLVTVRVVVTGSVVLVVVVDVDVCVSVDVSVSVVVISTWRLASAVRVTVCVVVSSVNVGMYVVTVRVVTAGQALGEGVRAHGQGWVGGCLLSAATPVQAASAMARSVANLVFIIIIVVEVLVGLILPPAAPHPPSKYSTPQSATPDPTASARHCRPPSHLMVRYA